MYRIAKHIEQLLLLHDCVIIPGIGGFVLQTVSASYFLDENLFKPMKKEIVFNSSLQHNDGLLIESYMRSYHVEFKAAQKMVDDDVEEIQKTLQQYGKIHFDSIGSIYHNANTQITFQPVKTNSFDTESYGLQAFHFPTLPPKSEEVSTDKEVLTFTISRKFIRYATASVAAIILFFVFSTPVGDMDQSTHKASLIPTTIVPATSKTVEPTVEIETETTTSTIETLPKIVEETNKKMYYLIIGSFPNEEKANQYISEIEKKALPDIGVVVRNGRHRVYAQKYNNREDAEANLSILKETSKHPDVWLFISR